MTKNYAVAIFAGGQSSRMGSDKAELCWNGASLLQHACANALRATDRVLVVGRERPADWPFESVEFILDEVADLGPLGGLQTVLELALRNDIDHVLAFACDLPLIDEAALRWLLCEAQEREIFHGLVVTRDGELEPLFSIYTPSCLPLTHHQLAQGRRSLHGLIERGDFEYVEAPPEIAVCLHNVNTPNDWAQIQNVRHRVLEHRVLDVQEKS